MRWDEKRGYGWGCGGGQGGKRWEECMVDEDNREWFSEDNLTPNE